MAGVGRVIRHLRLAGAPTYGVNEYLTSHREGHHWLIRRPPCIAPKRSTRKSLPSLLHPVRPTEGTRGQSDLNPGNDEKERRGPKESLHP